MEIKIAGHSGCRVEVVRESGRLLVRKWTEDPAYRERLRKQADKQQRFSAENRLGSITTPAILRQFETPESFGMVMEFVHARTFIDFFENASCAAPEEFAERMIAFLEAEFAASPRQPVPPDILTEKLASVQEHIAASPLLCGDGEIASLLRRAEAFFGRGRERMWPVGVCHGDLTLSNMLFQGSTVYLIDFLDSFVETPLMDLVKLRQDTRYCWSQLLCTEPFDRVKSRIVMEFLDRRLWEHFCGFPGVAEGYLELQCMNFLRILQYAKELRIIAFLKTHLTQLLVEAGV
ncbi:MAG: aminoglycoside phosphotransferase family protein [Lentisphaeria bacterium]|nr:aminoglycoside phosphotransferase family protein [Lentisphaeria bacterium]